MTRPNDGQLDPQKPRINEPCLHQYPDHGPWTCRLCGYQVPKALVEKIASREKRFLAEAQSPRTSTQANIDLDGVGQSNPDSGTWSTQHEN